MTQASGIEAAASDSNLRLEQRILLQGLEVHNGEALQHVARLTSHRVSMLYRLCHLCLSTCLSIYIWLQASSTASRILLSCQIKNLPVAQGSWALARTWVAWLLCKLTRT